MVFLVKISKEKQTALDWVDANEKMISGFDKRIWGLRRAGLEGVQVGSGLLQAA